MKKKSSIIILALSVLSIGAMLIFWKRIPDEVVIHWNALGEADGYGSKWMYLLLNLLPAFILLGGDLFAKIDPKKENYGRHEQTYWFLMNLLAFMFLVMNWIFLATALGTQIDITIVMPLIFGFLFMCIGNYLPRIKDNYFFGIRTPWTLADPIVWKKTHRAAGVAFILIGMFSFVSVFLPKDLRSGGFFILIICVVLFSFVYSYLCFKKIHKGES